ncbi:hypothetical protein RFI_37759 [Reticulomyxa filosa]|uniref:Uncharacterized protein n=1 Tax=Reticulomyxa filosa TaxID=46433 RepID=X6LDS6_RETFI|nr:hypothetical protein RFI_37759 [Reticulomyxa filosa]|eukprot:ETN99708.1 hypothetical protein RFI_37759 [Reticulomyxa filosa]
MKLDEQNQSIYIFSTFFRFKILKFRNFFTRNLIGLERYQVNWRTGIELIIQENAQMTIHAKKFFNKKLKASVKYLRSNMLATWSCPNFNSRLLAGTAIAHIINFKLFEFFNISCSTSHNIGIFFSNYTQFKAQYNDQYSRHTVIEIDICSMMNNYI